MTDKDKTTGTEQDTSSGKTGQSSGGKSGSTSKDKGKLYTDAMIVKIKSDAAAEAGRLRKAAEVERDTFKQDLETITSRFDALEREQNESRLTEARGDPDQLRTYQREQTLKTRERQVEETLRDLTRREGQLKADRAEIDKDRGVVSVAYLAAKHGLDVEKLESFGITDPEALEKVAEELAVAGKPPETAEEKTAREAREAAGEEHLELDTGETTGRGEPTEQERLDARYPTMKK